MPLLADAFHFPAIAHQHWQLADESLTQKHWAAFSAADHGSQDGHHFGQQRHRPLVPGLHPPAQLGLVPDEEPTTHDIQILDEQMGQLAYSQTRLGQGEVDGEGPSPRPL